MNISKLFSAGMSDVIDIVGSAFDGLFTSDEERLKAKNILESIKNDAKAKSKEFDLKFEEEFTKRLQQQTLVISAEINAESWMQRNCRPLTMLVFTFIIANHFILAPYIDAIFDLTIATQKLPDKMWGLLTIGMGGYISALGVKKVVESSKWSK
jgi:hypothetical protein